MKNPILYLVLSYLMLICTPAFGENIDTFYLHFESDKYELTPEMQSHITQHLNQLELAKTQYFFQVKGHTDTDGSWQYNLQLSENRANAIAAFLINQQFEAKHIFKKGLSFDKPKAANNTEAAKSENRRVEVIIATAHNKLTTLGGTSLETQMRSINPSIPNEIYYPTGSELSIPENAFVDASGEIYSGTVQVGFQEIQDYKDFILSDIPMSFINGEEQYFISSGMMNLTATTESGEPLHLANDKQIDVRLAATSEEEDVQFYQYDPATQKWLEVQQALTKTKKRVPVERQVKEVIPLERPACVNKNTQNIPLSDTTHLTRGVFFANYDTILTKNLRQQFNHKIKAHELNQAIAGLQAKINDQTQVYQLKTYNPKSSRIYFDITGPVKKNNSELRYLQFLSWKISDETKSILDFEQEFTEIEVGEVSTSSVSITCIAENGEEVDFTAQPFSTGKKTRFKNNVKNLEKMVHKTTERRHDKLEEYHAEMATLQAEYATTNLLVAQSTAALTEMDSCHQYDLGLVYQVYLRANYNAPWAGNSTYQFMKWACGFQDEPNYVATVLSETLADLRCVQAFYIASGESYQFVSRQYFTTASGAAASDMVYQFAVNQLGVYNVDKLMKVAEKQQLLVESYNDRTGVPLAIANLYLVDEANNSVIKFDGAFGYTPYSFVIEPDKNYGLIAIDIEGTSYKLAKLRQHIHPTAKEQAVQLKMDPISPTEVGDFLAVAN